MLRFFWMPKEVWLYVVIPICIILISYFIFYISYRRKKGTYYYDYVLDYVYSTLGILFCSLLFCLLLGYSIATMQLLIVNKVIKDHLLLTFVVAFLPVIPTCFLIYVIRVYLKNLKRKERLDEKFVSKEEELKKKTNSTSLV